MNGRKLQVGIDRPIRLKWLEHTASFVMAGIDEKALKNELERVLSSTFPSSASDTRGSLSKTITILIKTWLRVPRDLHALRDAALELLPDVKKNDRIAIHWGMIMAVYPFWGVVAAQTGRLLRLQGNVSAIQLQRRLREQYGERETVSRRVRYMIRGFIDWGVLRGTNAKGLYTAGASYSIESPRLSTWLVEASLHSRMNSSAAIKNLLDSPSIFPFRLAHISADHLASLSPRLELLRHGLDEDLVKLRDRC